MVVTDTSCLLLSEQSQHSLLVAYRIMYLLVICLFLPLVDTVVIVKIHRSAIYCPVDDCVFLRNVSRSLDASIQSCIWECVHEDKCGTAVYFDDENVCSMFAESCQSDSIQSSGNDRASVICYRTNLGEFCFVATLKKTRFRVY